jgi:ribosomal protein S18 acetylase RimI-like enzyme
VRDGIARLQPGDRAGSEAVARLHAALLPDSPIARLGPHFMGRFYYEALVADQLIGCHMAYVEGAPAGFITLTARPATFMAEGLRRHWPRLAWVLAREVVSSPRRLGVMLWTFGLMRRRAAAPVPGEGELLSFGVLPEFRDMAFVRRTGRRIASELFAAALADLRAAGLDRYRAVVVTNNAAALMFYQAQGGRADPDRVSLPGTLVITGSTSG